MLSANDLIRLRKESELKRFKASKTRFKVIYTHGEEVLKRSELTKEIKRYCKNITSTKGMSDQEIAYRFYNIWSIGSIKDILYFDKNEQDFVKFNW